MRGTEYVVATLLKYYTKWLCPMRSLMYHTSLPYALRAASIALSMCSLSEPSHITCVLPPCFLLSDQSTSSVPSHACPDIRSIFVRIQGFVANRSGVVGDEIRSRDKIRSLR